MNFNDIKDIKDLQQMLPGRIRRMQRGKCGC